MLIFHYKTKKELKAQIGKPLDYSETSFFGPEFKADGVVTGTNHPKRSWFANVTMKEGLILKVN